MLCLRPGPVLFWTGRRSACPGAVDHAARLDRARPPWACYALRGQLPPRLPWAGPPGPLPEPPPPGPPLPARISPPAPAILPPRFSPMFPAGIFPVTRAAGDSPAHNAKPRRSPRNASSINHSDMKSTNFMRLRLHKTVEFCNITSIFAKTSQIPRKYFQFSLLSVNYGSTKPLPLGRKKSAAPGLGATLVQFGHSLFNLVMRRPK